MKVLFYTALIVAADQVSKLLVKGFSIPFLNINHQGMFQGQRINIIGDFFRITYIENPGMAFGVDPGLNLKLYTSLFSLIASIGLIIYIYHIRKDHFATRFSLSLILGGAIGNLIDRMLYGVLYGYAPVFYGKVVDFLDFNFFDVTIFGRSYDRFPIFNIADSAVTVGVFLLLIFYGKLQKKETAPAALTEEIPLSEYPENLSQEEISTDNIQQENNSTDENINKPEQDDDEPGNGKEIPL